MEDWVHSMRDNFGRLPNNAPPLAVNWLKAKDELAACQLTDNLVLSESTVRMLQLSNDLKLLKSHINLLNQIQLLKGDAVTYNNTCYRLYIAAGYYSENISFELYNDLQQPDLILTNGATAAIVTTAPVINNVSTLVSTAQLEAKNALQRLPNGEGIIYLDLPLSVYQPEHLLSQINQRCEITGLDKNISFIVTFTYIKNQFLPKLERQMYLLKKGTHQRLLCK